MVKGEFVKWIFLFFDIVDVFFSGYDIRDGDCIVVFWNFILILVRNIKC